MTITTLPRPPRVGLVSLGCPKALVDSERIMTRLRADGYDMSPDYAGADVVLVNTCGFLDSAILIVLTARKRAPDLKISVTIRMAENEDIAHQAGADTVVNPVSFAGLLLASSLDGPNRADYLNDLATSEGQVMLREREVEQHEVGKSADEICTGQAVRLIRDNKPHGPKDPAFGRVIPGDRVLEIIDSTA